MATIGSLVTSLSLESAAFTRGLHQARQSLDSNTRQMRLQNQTLQQSFGQVQNQVGALRNAIGALAGVLAIRQFARWTEDALKAVGGLGELAASAGVTTKALQEFTFAGVQAGLSQETIVSSLQRFSRRLGEAAEGTGTLVKILDKYKISIRDSGNNTRRANDVISDLADAMQGANSAAEQVRIATEAFGRAGAQMVPILIQGSEGLKKFSDQAHAAGLILSDELIASADKTGDAIASLRFAMERGFQIGIVRSFGDSVSSSTDALTQAREAGETFGRTVGTAMRAVAEAASFAARNFDLLVAIVAAFAAFKLATIVLNIAVAMVQLARAIRLAAAGMAMFNALSKGIVGILAAIASVAAGLAAYNAVAGQVESETNAMLNELAAFNGVLEGTGVAAGNAADAMGKMLAEAKRQNTQLLALESAYSGVGASVEQVRAAMELDDKIRAAGITRLQAEEAGLLDVLRANQTLTGSIEALTEARKQEAEQQKRIGGAIEHYEIEIRQLQELKEAYRSNESVVKSVMQAIAVENDLRQRGISLLEAQESGLYDNLVAYHALKSEIEGFADAQKKAVDEQRRSADLMLEPFRNAIRSIQDAFTNMFEDIFSGGVNSFTDLAATIKRIFIRLAAEIAALMVIRPVLGNVLTGAGMGGLAQQMGMVGGLAGVGGSVAGGSSGIGGIGPLGVTLASGFSTVTNAINTLGTNFGFAAAAAGPAANPWGGPIGGFNFVKPGIFGGQTLAGFLGAGALGAGIGGLGASALGLSKQGTIGSSVGGGLGAAVGSIVPGIGTIVGGIGGSIIGGIVGSLFKSKPSDKSQDAAINFVTNSIERWGQTGDKFSQQNRDLADQLAQQAIELSNAIQALTGGRATGDLGIKVGSREGLRLSQGGQQIGAFGQDVERFQSAMVKAIADSIKGVGGIERQILSRADTSSAESLLADLQFGQVFRELTQQARPLTAELNAMKQQFADAKVQARRLGLDVQLLRDAQRETAQAFRQGLMTELRVLAGEISPISQAFNELRDRFKAVKKEANSIGLNRDEIIRLQRVALKDFRQGIMGELKALAGAATPAAQAFEALIAQFRAAKRAANEIGLNRNEIQKLQKQAANDFRKGFLASLSDATGVSGVNDFTKQMAALTQQFVQARKEARAIGISVATINKMQMQAVESLQKSFMDELRGLAGISGTFSDELETLVDRFALARKEANALGLSIVEIRRLEAQAIQNFTQKAIDSIESRMAQQAQQIRAHFDSILTPLRNFRTSLDFGPLSANAPTEQFRLAQDQFRSLAAEAANSNRAALEALPNAAQAFIQQAQSVFASSGQASAVAEVKRVFDSLISAQEILQVEMTRDLPDAIDDAANRQVRALREGFDQLAAELRDVKREIQAANQRRVA